jgi:MFS family permease
MTVALPTPLLARSPMGTVLAVMLARIAFGFQLQTVATLGPELMAAFHLDFAALGTLMGAYMLPGVLVAIPAGFLARRFGEDRVLSCGLLLMTAGSVLVAIMDSRLGIGIGRGVSGAGAVAITVVQGKLLSDRFEGPRFTRALSVIVGAFPIGIGAAQLVQPRLAMGLGLGAPFLAGAAISAAAWLLFVLTWNGDRPVAGRRMSWPSRREILLVILAGMIWTTYNAGYFNFLAYMPGFLASRGHPAWVADVVMLLSTWGNLPAVLLGTALALRFGKVPVFLVGTALCAISVSGSAVLDMPLLWGLLFGTIASMPGGLIIEVGTLSARPENRAVGMGVFYTTYFIGGSITPALCGLAADAAGGPSGALVCAAGLSLLAVPFFFLHRMVARR